MCSVLCVLFQILVSPAPAGGNTNWFDPFFEVSMYKVYGDTFIRSLNGILLNCMTNRPVSSLDVELIILVLMTMKEMLIM